MRKPRDFDAELAALHERAKRLKARRVQQLGELVLATRADALEVEVLAGALLAAAKSNTETREVWRENGARFFQRARRNTRSARRDRSSAPQDGGTQGSDPAATRATR